ncbi:hypothetical protein EJB05_32892, partial [Eragrostis curvula]
MDVDSVECLSLPDASMDVDDGDSQHHGRPHHHLGLPLHPAHIAAAAGRAFPKANATGAGAIVPAAGGGPPATSVHELLECPVCTNSMFPPIHQVGAPACPFPPCSSFLALWVGFEAAMALGGPRFGDFGG